MQPTENCTVEVVHTAHTERQGTALKPVQPERLNKIRNFQVTYLILSRRQRHKLYCRSRRKQTMKPNALVRTPQRLLEKNKNSLESVRHLYKHI